MLIRITEVWSGSAYYNLRDEIVGSCCYVDPKALNTPTDSAILPPGFCFLDFRSRMKFKKKSLSHIYLIAGFKYVKITPGFNP